MKHVTALKAALAVVAMVALLSGGVALAKEGKQSEQGWLGITLQDLSPSMARALQMESDDGILVNEVMEDSPAEAAGLQDGDIIITFGGREIADTDDLHKAVRKTAPGETVDVVVIRDGKQQTIAVEVGEREEEKVIVLRSSDAPHAPHMQWHDQDGANIWHFKSDGDAHDIYLNRIFGRADHGFLGVHLDDLSEQLGEYFEVEDGEGALISEVIEDSPAAESGLAAGDVIVSVGAEKVASSKELKKALAEFEPEDEVELTIIRKGQLREVSVVLSEFPEDMDDAIDIDIDLSGLHSFSIPKMLKFHGQHDLEELELNEEELDELRDEMKELKRELKQLQEEFQNR